MVLKTIDVHVSGTTIRLIVDGFPSPHGATLQEKRVWAERHADHLRRAALLEPRGRPGLIGAVLTESHSPRAHAGILVFDTQGSRALSYEAVIAVADSALRHGLLMPGDAAQLVFDLPAGEIQVTVDSASGEARCLGVPAFVCAGGIEVQCGNRTLKADLAYAGELVAIVDNESAGVALAVDTVPELARASRTIVRWFAERAGALAKMTGVHEDVTAVIFTGPAQGGGADLRTVMVRSDGTVERSPAGSGLAAVMAVLHAMGLISPGGVLTTEGIVETTLTGILYRGAMVGEREGIVPEIRGRAWAVGEHVLRADPNDPLRRGFQLG